MSLHERLHPRPGQNTFKQLEGDSWRHLRSWPRRKYPARPSNRDARAAWRLHTAFRADEIGKIRPAEILRPAERRGVELVIADIRIGAGFEQQPCDIHRAALAGHVQRRAVAVPYRALGVDGNAMCE